MCLERETAGELEEAESALHAAQKRIEARDLKGAREFLTSATLRVEYVWELVAAEERAVRAETQVQEVS
jgi:hypothetical protein